jgi:hypothetical protein
MIRITSVGVDCVGPGELVFGLEYVGPCYLVRRDYSTSSL